MDEWFQDVGEPANLAAGALLDPGERGKVDLEVQLLGGRLDIAAGKSRRTVRRRRAQLDPGQVFF
jgi:hypothetical protein